MFHSDEDRLLYLKLLREHSERHRLRMWGYCLMDNHVHLIAVPATDQAMARTLRRAHADYARYANMKRSTAGHFWQNRYFSCPMDKAYCWTALAYVERNPVRAGKVPEAERYPWSSAQAHLAGRDPSGWLDLSEWSMAYGPERWRRVLRTTVQEEAELERIREATRSGRPLGENEFVQALEGRLHRSLVPGRPGRCPGATAVGSFAEAGGIGN